MIGIYRSGAESCKLVLGHQEFVGDLSLAWEVSEGIKRALRDGPGITAVLYEQKLAIEKHEGRLWLHVHSGTAPTHWFTTCPREELLAWCSHFLHLVAIDEWDDGSIPAERGHLIPMRLAAFRQHKGPYAKAWALLRYFGYVPAGTPIPDEPYEKIAAFCRRPGLKMKRLHVVA